MNPDYSHWTKSRLIAEIVMLREGLHRACNEGNRFMIRNLKLQATANALRLRLAFQERIKAFFHGA